VSDDACEQGNYYGSRCHDNTYDCMISPYLAIKAKLPQAVVAYSLGTSLTFACRSANRKP
jgi:hypothetical protein